MSKDVHLKKSCTACHRGDAAAPDKAPAHKNLISRPSDNPATCSPCHNKITDNFKKSLHYTTAGLRGGIYKRFSAQQAGRFDKEVFEQSCRSCHASCGDCHVKTPVVSGVDQGLFANHRFQKKNEDKTCAACHGGRIYSEFSGRLTGVRDIHFEKGMHCADCHRAGELHGDGTQAAGKQSAPGKPSCTNCHNQDKFASSAVHRQHAGKASCQACHVASEYNQCASCHIGEGASQSQAFLLGADPQNKERVVTLRMTPAARDTFAAKGIFMDNYDKVANFWTAPVHNIRKKTARTRTCGPCHTEDKEGFITEKNFSKEGSKQNSVILYDYKSFKTYRRQ